MDFATLRRTMVKGQLAARGIKDPAVLKAFGEVERHLFVPEPYRAQSYEDHPLPIGRGQTISQPYIVALMSEALELKGGEKVLEVGSGSGYQAAILAQMGCRVFSVEREPALAEEAAKNLAAAGFSGRVTVFAGDGTLGLSEEAPFDAIIVTAGAPFPPPSLKAQLKEEGGVLVIPAGSHGFQELLKITRNGDSFTTENLGGCRFVPLVGKEGW